MATLKEITKTFFQLVDQENYTEVREFLLQIDSNDVSRLINMSKIDDQLLFFRLLNKDVASNYFTNLDSKRKKQFIKGIIKNISGNILNKSIFDEKNNQLDEVPANFARYIISSCYPSVRPLINKYLCFSNDSAGSIMTQDFVELQINMTVYEANKLLKEAPVDPELIFDCYVIDAKNRISGVISSRKLQLMQPDLLIDAVKEDTNFVFVNDDQEMIAKTFKKLDLITLPVVDSDKCLVGIISVTDILDVIEDENTEDFEKMAAMTPSDDAYLKSNVLSLAKKRIVWLIILLFTATLTGGIITHFEKLLSSAVVLTAFIPMLMNSGGNAGSQSSTLIIRGMALGEIELTDWLKVVWKEIRVGIIAGSILAVVNFFRMYFFSDIELSIMYIVSFTLLITIIGAKLVGGVLPIISKALHLDPAIMAGPFITTIVDTFTLLLFFSIANMFI